MKHNYIPLEKQSKRKQKEFHTQQRKSWGNFKPATKKAENGKAYNRKKMAKPFFTSQTDYNFLPEKNPSNSDKTTNRCLDFLFCLVFSMLAGFARVLRMNLAAFATQAFYQLMPQESKQRNRNYYCCKN